MQESQNAIEQCPFCGSAVYPGATVCAACGAYKDKLHSLPFFLRFILRFVAVLLVIFGFGSGEPLIIILFFIIAGLFVKVSFLKSPMKWLRKM